MPADAIAEPSPEAIKALVDRIEAMAVRLKAATDGLGTDASPRELAIQAVEAVGQFFDSCGYDISYTAVLHRLRDELCDLDDGRVGEMVKPAAVKPSQSRSTWLAKVFLVAALEAEHALGDRLNDAAKTVVRRVGEKNVRRVVSGSGHSERQSFEQLLEVRKELRKSRGAGPATGEHIGAQAHYSGQMCDAMKLPANERQTRFTAIRDDAIEQFAEHLRTFG